MIIIGAGLSGCIAGALTPGSRIYEAQPTLPAAHGAVLRFRSSKVGDALRIPFRRVRVRKAIYLDGATTHSCSPRAANLYSRKVLRGGILDRSIWELEATDRWIAPSNFHTQLADRCDIVYDAQLGPGSDEKHLYFNLTGALARFGTPVVSTIPMRSLAKALSLSDELATVDFRFQSIYTARTRVPRADVFQTIYFPDEHLGLYRATITGDDLILESVQSHLSNEDREAVEDALGLEQGTLIGRPELDRPLRQQSYGKIEPIDEAVRRNFLLTATLRHNVYSLGRFACWRNILLDDVLDDYDHIRSMIASGPYSISKHWS